jgi:hypothetical protein
MAGRTLIMRCDEIDCFLHETGDRSLGQLEPVLVFGDQSDLAVTAKLKSLNLNLRVLTGLTTLIK